MRRLCAIFVVCAIALGGSQGHAQPSREGMANAEIQTEIKPPKRKRLMTVLPVIGGGVGWFSMTGNSGNASVISTNQANFTAGGLVDIHFGRLAFETGLLYLREGSRVELTSNNPLIRNDSADGTVNIQHLGVPLLGKVGLNATRNMRLTMKAGVMPSYAFASSSDFSEDQVYYSSAINESFTNKAWTSENIRKLNVFGIVGAGANFMLGGGKTITTELVFDRSLLSVNEYNSNNNEVFSQSIMLVIGMGFGIY